VYIVGARIFMMFEGYYANNITIIFDGIYAGISGLFVSI